MNHKQKKGDITHSIIENKGDITHSIIEDYEIQVCLLPIPTFNKSWSDLKACSTQRGILLS